MATSVPSVVKFAFKDFYCFTEKLKWRATCSHCKETINESRNTTTGFNK